MSTTLKNSFLNYPPKGIVGRARKVGNNTFEYHREDGTRVVRLHLTDIIEVRPDGKVKLNTGGWKTHTTKARFNSHSRYRVYSDRGLWYVNGDGKSVPFFDGMVLPDALVDTTEADKQAAEQLALKKKIKAFLAKTLANGMPVPVPNNGDCWECLMFDQEPPRGDANLTGWVSSQTVDRSSSRSVAHLMSHIDEHYMHGSLIVNAFRAAGFKDEGISYLCYGPRPDYTRIRRVVQRYLGRRLGLAT